MYLAFAPSRKAAMRKYMMNLRRFMIYYLQGHRHR